MDQATLRSYKLTHDSGFAPNPFFGFLTLATCKPGIRRHARVGEWIAGFTSGTLCSDAVGSERLVYLMKVAERMTIAAYFNDARFAAKKPIMSGRAEVDRHGDNIYRPLCADAMESNEFEQIINPHHWDHGGGCAPPKSKRKDISGTNVLVATEYFYFGRKTLAVPASLRPEVPKGQSVYGSLTRDLDRVRAFVDYVRTHSAGRVMGPPHDWPPDDQSWRS